MRRTTRRTTRRTSWTRGTAVALSVAAVVAGVAAPAQAEVTNDTTVQAWYRTHLDRTSDDAKADPGRLYWVSQLDRGAKPSDVLWQLLHSREYVSDQVSDYYNSYLFRAPDGGAAYWIDGASQRGVPLEWVAQNVLASDEYWTRHNGQYGGSYATAFWYIDILGRAGDDGGAAYWADRARRVGRLQAVREMWYSDEAVRHRIDVIYRDVLIRSADFEGVQYWYPKEIESDVNVRTLVGSSPEFSRWIF